MAIILKEDEIKGITFDSYNNLNRIEMLNLLTGDTNIRIAKYSSEEYRRDNPQGLIHNAAISYVKLNEKDLNTIKDILYKYVSELDEYKEGVKA